MSYPLRLEFLPCELEVGTVQLARLAQLGDLKAAGVLTEAEFEAQKARILGS